MAIFIKEKKRDRIDKANYGAFVVTDVASSIVDTNQDRISILIQNTSTNDITLGFDSTVTTTKGIVLDGASADGGGDGGSYATSDYTGPIFLIAPNSGSSTVQFIEF